MSPQNLNQAQALPAIPLAPPTQTSDHHPPPDEVRASQLFQGEQTAAIAQPDASFTGPAEAPSPRGGIAPHAYKYHRPQAPTRRLMQRFPPPAAEPVVQEDLPELTPEQQQAAEAAVEQPSANGLAITGLILAFIFAPLGLMVSIRALARRKTKSAKVISTFGITLSSLGIALMIMFTLAVTSSFATVRGHNSDMQQQTSLEAVQNRLQAAFISNGTYPSLAQLNDSSWRAHNLVGTEASDLSPGTKPTPLVSGQATVDSYAYNVVPSGCAGTRQSPCTSFTLAAAMSTGEEYTVQ